MAPKSWSH